MKDIEEMFVNSINDAARLLSENAEYICGDLESEKVKGINIHIYISRDEVSCDICKEYALNPNYEVFEC